MAQFVGLFPRSYAEAWDWVKAHKVNNHWTRPLCTGCRLHSRGEAMVSVQCQGVDLVTWIANGRIRISTRGRNDGPTLAKINACLPDGYRVTKKGGAVRLEGPGGMIAVFLSSTFFCVEVGEAASATPSVAA